MRFGWDGCTDYDGNPVVPYHCMDGSCLKCNGSFGRSFNDPCCNSPAGRIVAKPTDVPVALQGCQGMKDSPATWLAAVVGTLSANNKAPFKMLSTRFGPNRQEHIRILNKETGAVWLFTCCEERPPA